jgi:hypothetical protein
LRIERSVGIERTRGYPDWFQDSLDFFAFGEMCEESRKLFKKEGPAQERYSVGLTPVSEYSHLPLVIDEEVEIYKDPIFSRKGRCLENYQVLGKATCTYMLLDILDAIYDDISFYGSPAKRDEQHDELVLRVDEIKELQSEGGMKTKTYATFEEMMDDENTEGYDAFTVDHSLDASPDDPPEDHGKTE